MTCGPQCTETGLLGFIYPISDQDQAASKSPVTPYSSLSNAELKYVSQSMYGGETEIEIVNNIWFYFSVSLRTVRD